MMDMLLKFDVVRVSAIQQYKSLVVYSHGVPQKQHVLVKIADSVTE